MALERMRWGLAALVLLGLLGHSTAAFQHHASAAHLGRFRRPAAAEARPATGLVTDGTWRLSGGSGARRQSLKALQMSSSKGSCIVPLVKRAGQAVASIAILAALACPMAPETAVAAPTEAAETPEMQQASAGDPFRRRIQEKAELFGEILADLQDKYVEPINVDKLAETGYQAMLSSLDPYTEFENVESAQEMREATVGNYAGVGLVVNRPRDMNGVELPYISVLDAAEGYAYDNGMRVGDQIVSIDGVSVKDISQPQISKMLRGDAGSKVVLKFSRPGIPGVQSCELTRQVVQLRDVPLGMFLGGRDERIGYVKLQGFSSSAPAELAYVLSQLQEDAPLKSLVLDLRDNPGGLLSSAIRVSELFIKEGDKIVSTRGRTVTADDLQNSASISRNSIASKDSADAGMSGSSGWKRRGLVGVKKAMFEETYNSDPIEVRFSREDAKGGGRRTEDSLVFHPPLLDTQTKMVVLVNSKTASAAEIVAGALQDHDRAIIVGETTYGKGLVQQLQKVGKDDQGLQLKVTIGKYYTPSGRCIQSKKYISRDGALGTDETIIKNEERSVFFTDHGRKVRDGGGIEPDVIKKESSSGVLERELMRKDLFFKYADVWQAKQIKLAKGAAQPLVAHTALANSLRHPSILVTDEVYQDFKNFVHEQQTDEDVESPFDESLDILQTVLRQNGFGEAVGDVDGLKEHLRAITQKEFETNERSIKKRLDLTIRQRFVPGSIISSFSLLGDDQFEEAWNLAHDDTAYQTLVSGSQDRSFPKNKDKVAKSSRGTPKQMVEKRAPPQKGKVAGAPLHIPKPEGEAKVLMTRAEMTGNINAAAALSNGRIAEVLAEGDRGHYFL